MPLLNKYFVLPKDGVESEAQRSRLVRRAQAEIPDLLSTEGYFGAKVVLDIPGKDGKPVLVVDPGPRATVRDVNIEFRGDVALPREPQLGRVRQMRTGWTLSAGMPFRAAAWEDAKAALLAELSDRDYASAQLLDSSASVDVDKASVQLTIVMDSGPRYTFGAMKITGLQRYDELLVKRYATFSLGQPYRRDLLLSFQNALQNLPQFESVIVTLDTAATTGKDGTQQDSLAAPVKVQVVEAQSRRISLGVGYGSNNGVRNEANYQSYNFLNRAWKWDSAVAVEQNRQTISAGLETPPNPLGYHLTWKASGEKTQIQDLETVSDKFGVTRSRSLYGIDTGIGLHWQQERRLPQGGIRQTDQALVLDWGWKRSTVDNPLFPLAGSLTEVRVGGASKSVFSDQDFVRSFLRHQLWLSRGSDVVTLRVEGGYTASVSRLGIPQEYLFRVGGTQTVRGFAYQSLGVQEGNAIVGGRSMATASVEYTHWWGTWGGALFCDTGSAADVAADLKLSTGYGAGLRWHSPVGPLALDLAQGRGQPRAMLHFAIAVAF
jgi:translocation and assembly module TamA